MAKDIKVVTARRAYLYRLDDIRLSTLTTTEVAAEVQRIFDFKAGTIATPPPYFGLVPETNPPGLIFNHGSLRLSNDAPLLIRFLHFEPQRVVIDAAGPSSALDEVFRRLSDFLNTLRTADGASIFGEPIDMQDYSEVSANLDFDFGELVSKPVLEAVQQLSAAGRSGGYPSSINFRVGEPSFEVGLVEPHLSIQTRAGTRTEEHSYFSALWMTSNDNIAWLEALEKRVGKT